MWTIYSIYRTIQTAVISVIHFKNNVNRKYIRSWTNLSVLLTRTALRYHCTVGWGEPTAAQGTDTEESIFCCKLCGGLSFSIGLTTTAIYLYCISSNHTNIFLLCIQTSIWTVKDMPTYFHQTFWQIQHKGYQNSTALCGKIFFQIPQLTVSRLSCLLFNNWSKKST